ncbi:hypothetical protein L6R52_37015, partial [Myxococcota bacterium]|nr:hypothetical protein [Myxococcota bacterium]
MRLPYVPALALTASVLAACGADAELAGPTAEAPRPAVRALSSYRASLGTLIEVYGADFPAATDAAAELVFRGAFVASDGNERAVDRALAARIVDGSTLRWTSFGPYDNPFAPGSSHTGRFRGTVHARVLPHDGTAAVDGAPLELELDVEPSIVVRE